MVWSVGDVVIDELAHLTRKRKTSTLFPSLHLHDQDSVGGVHSVAALAERVADVSR